MTRAAVCIRPIASPADGTFRHPPHGLGRRVVPSPPNLSISVKGTRHPAEMGNMGLMRKALGLVAAVLGLVLVPVGPHVDAAIEDASTDADLSVTAQSVNVSAEEFAFLNRLNEVRASVGAQPLALSSELTVLSQQHSTTMAAAGAIFHRSPLDTGVPDVWLRLGENVGRGGSVDVLHNAFMASPAHQANIVNGHFNYVGLGVFNASGTLYVTQIFMEAAPGSVATVSPSAPVGTSTIPFERTSGIDRFATAAAISQDSFPNGAGIAFLAVASDFPDALAAGPAAANRRGPVLLTAKDALPQATADELRRLSPELVVLVGGALAIPDAIAAAVEAATGAEVIRLSGFNRFDTAAAIARFFASSADKAYVATGSSFPDALAGGAAAAHLGAPILLTERDNLPEATAAVLRDLGVREIVVLGGESAVSAAVLDQLRALAPTVRRISGVDRFATASAIAADAFPDALASTYLATGGNFPDALAGAAAAGMAGSPLMLTQQNCVPSSVRMLIEERDPELLVLLGGEAALTDGVGVLTSC